MGSEIYFVVRFVVSRALSGLAHPFGGTGPEITSFDFSLNHGLLIALS